MINEEILKEWWKVKFTDLTKGEIAEWWLSKVATAREEALREVKKKIMTLPKRYGNVNAPSERPLVDYGRVLATLPPLTEPDEKEN